MYLANPTGANINIRNVLYILSVFIQVKPAAISLMTLLGVEGSLVKVILTSSNPPERAVAMAQVVTLYKDPNNLADLSYDLGKAMFGVLRSEAIQQSYGLVVKGDIIVNIMWNLLDLATS